jgi:hypothetical protein
MSCQNFAWMKQLANGGNLTLGTGREWQEATPKRKFHSVWPSGHFDPYLPSAALSDVRFAPPFHSRSSVDQIR